MIATVETIQIGTVVRDLTTGNQFTIDRLPTSRKKSIGARRANGSEVWIWKNELPRFVIDAV